MDAVTAVLSVLLAAACAYAAARKLSHAPDVVAAYARAGVPERWLNPLAAVLIAAAGALVLGLFATPVRVGAAAFLVGYFVVATAAHARSHDLANAPTPVVLGLASAATVALSLF